jgi:hypothetical protein
MQLLVFKKVELLLYMYYFQKFFTACDCGFCKVCKLVGGYCTAGRQRLRAPKVGTGVEVNKASIIAPKARNVVTTMVDNAFLVFLRTCPDVDSQLSYIRAKRLNTFSSLQDSGFSLDRSTIAVQTQHTTCECCDMP